MGQMGQMGQNKWDKKCILSLHKGHNTNAY